MISKSYFILLLTLVLGIPSNGQDPEFVFDGSKSIPLKGEWNLVMDSFLTYEEVLRDESAVKINVPGTWNETIWNGEKIGPFGYGTYYATLVVDHPDEIQTLAIEISEISLAYHLYINDELVGKRGRPGVDEESELPKINYGIFDFKVNPKDTVTLIFHVSNFGHESGGVWYAPNLDFESRLRNASDFNRIIMLMIVGCIFVGGVFQVYIFLKRRKEKSALYFFFVCASMVMISVSRGDMPLMDVFPDLSWQSLKKVVYISLFLIAPMNGLFLRELFPKYFHARLIDAMVIIGIAVTLFTLAVSPRISYSIVPVHHIYNVIIGLYLLFSVARAAYNGEFGSRFLLVGYLAAFLTALHDILSSQYIIEGYSFSMIHIGMIFYIFQLIAVIAGRYIFALNGKEELSAHLKKVNSELEEMVRRRTKDLIEQKELVEQKNNELHKALVEKDHLMAVVAHDLKAPLSSIMGISDLMMSDLKGQTAEFNKMIQKVTLDGRKLIENLTDLKVYEQDDFEADLSKINLKTFFENKLLSFVDLAEKKDIELQSDISDRYDEFTFDESILSRIIDNLLSNAIKFTPKKGNVFLSVQLTGKDLEIRIKDNGPGFKPRDKEKLFQKFQRLSARPTGGESSTGLGLSIVKTLVEKFDGSIQLNDQIEEGAEFIIHIQDQQSKP